MAAGREIRLRIRGIQYDNFDPVETVQEVQASYFFRTGAHYLLYEEQPEGFEQVIKTRVKRRGEYLEINRQGPMGGSMVFEPGKTYRMEYATPFGTLMLDIVTEAVEVMLPGESPKGTMMTVPEDSAGITPESANSVESGSGNRAESDTGSWQNVKIQYVLENRGEALGKYELYIEKI